MAIIAAHSYRRSIDLNNGLAAVQCARIRSTRIDGQTSPLTDHPLALSLSWHVADIRKDRLSSQPRDFYRRFDRFFFFLFFPPRSSRSNDPRVVSKWLIGCPSSEVFHRFVSRENDENSKEMERESRVRFARDISRYLWIVLITKNSSKYACQRSNFF